MYSNSNYNLLAYIIEEESGLSYGNYLDKYILSPINMIHTLHHADPSRIIPHLAEGYIPTGEYQLKKAPYLDWSIKTGNGSLISTVDDLLLFSQSFISGQLLNLSGIETMISQQFGLFSGQLGSQEIYYINGRSPGYTARLTRIPSINTSIIILSNNYTGTVVDDITGRIAGQLLGEDVSFVTPPQKVDLTSEQLDQYLGKYRFEEDYFVPNLECQITRLPSIWNFESDATTTALIPTASNRFFMRLYWGYGGFEEGKLFLEFFGKKYYASLVSKD